MAAKTDAHADPLCCTSLEQERPQCNEMDEMVSAHSTIAHDSMTSTSPAAMDSESVYFAHASQSSLASSAFRAHVTTDPLFPPPQSLALLRNEDDVFNASSRMDVISPLPSGLGEQSFQRQMHLNLLSPASIPHTRYCNHGKVCGALDCACRGCEGEKHME